MNLLDFKRRKKAHRQRMADVFHGILFSFLVTSLVTAGATLAFLKTGKLNFKTEVFASNNKEISSGEPVEILFSLPMRKSSVEKNLKVTPQISYLLNWENDQKLLFIPNEKLYPGKEYLIEIPASQTQWLIPQKEIKVSFWAQSYPKIVGIFPQNGDEEVEIDENIEIKFDKEISDYQVRIKTSPFFEAEAKVAEGEKAIIIDPQEDWRYSTRYQLKISLEHKKFDDFSADVFDGFFVTKESPKVVFSFDKNGNPIKQENQAEEIEPQIKSGKYIDIDLSSQSLFIFENGIKKGGFKISSGKRGMDTPTGTFKVLAKAKRPWSQKYGLYMPWFIQFTYEGHGIHELPEWPGGYKEGASHLGIPVSHGCVRLGIGPAKVVYDFAEVGTPIIIHE